jgi:NTP pyrophosphatase (non-canonical NTP hydrolase)
MKPSEYVKNVLRTESTNFEAIKNRFDEPTIRLMHAFIGIATEAGEINDAMKKHLFYGKAFDTANAVEELGDLMWYIGVACDTLGVSLEEVMEKNIAKLRARYGEKFSEQAALNRNLDTERKILEG